MNLPLLIARRLRFRPEDRTSTSPGIIIATAGVALATIIMLLSVSIVTGFKHQIREKVEGFYSQITIFPYSNSQESASELITVDENLENEINNRLPQGATIQATVSHPAIIKTDNDFAGVIFKSEPEKPSQSFISQNIVDGTHPDYSLKVDSIKNAIIISNFLANKLNLKVGDRPMVYFINGERIKTRKLNIAAIYDTHLGDFDKTMVFCSPNLIRGVLRLDSLAATTIEINGIEEDMIEPTAMALTTIDTGGQQLQIATVHQTGAMYFNWLSLLDTNVIVILILMALVAGFTLISSTFIIILERVKTIGIFKTLGMPNKKISRIFSYMGMRLVGRGLIIGNVLGLGLLLLQMYFKIIPLDPEAYYLDYVPVEINVWFILLLNVAIILIAALMLLLPTRIVSRMDPTKSLNYE